MTAAARRVTLLAVALAACSPTAERRAQDSADSAATAATSDTAATPASAATAAPSGAATAEREASAADSVRGVVERVGSDPTSRLVVRGAGGALCALRMSASPSFEGLEVTLWGRREAASATMLPGVTCAFEAERYAVRAVDGIAAVDGTLRLADGAYLIETTDGQRRPLRDVPAALRSQVGARVYWAGPLDRTPAAYGVLAPAP